MRFLYLASQLCQVAMRQLEYGKPDPFCQPPMGRFDKWEVIAALAFQHSLELAAVFGSEVHIACQHLGGRAHVVAFEQLLGSRECRLKVGALLVLELEDIPDVHDPGDVVDRPPVDREARDVVRQRQLSIL